MDRPYDAIPEFRAAYDATEALASAEEAFVAGRVPFSAVEAARDALAGAERRIYAMDDADRAARIDAIDLAAIKTRS